MEDRTIQLHRLDRPHLHGIHNLRTYRDSADDDYRVSRVQPALCREIFEGFFNRVLRLDEVEFRDKGGHTPIDRHLARRAVVVA